ncbi:unnamed protein product [Protopolystoma xenopodis]|uniref:Uncharacterized protein n=1 Tax=Protopolystoma xenopodis TaxID=117903 RepID=A0A3S5CQR8_9PLAT|nr:unnamed protein product [Protopolystoma xenopodis]
MGSDCVAWMLKCSPLYVNLQIPSPNAASYGAVEEAQERNQVCEVTALRDSLGNEF